MVSHPISTSPSNIHAGDWTECFSLSAWVTRRVKVSMGCATSTGSIQLRAREGQVARPCAPIHPLKRSDPQTKHSRTQLFKVTSSHCALSADPLTNFLPISLFLETKTFQRLVAGFQLNNESVHVNKTTFSPRHVYLLTVC